MGWLTWGSYLNRMKSWNSSKNGSYLATYSSDLARQRNSSEISLGSREYPLVNVYITMGNHHFQWEKNIISMGHFPVQPWLSTHMESNKLFWKMRKTLLKQWQFDQFPKVKTHKYQIIMRTMPIQPTHIQDFCFNIWKFRWLRHCDFRFLGSGLWVESFDM